MTQFSSREPFNDDPFPFLSGVGNRHATNLNPALWTCAPRPEFDRPQTNPTNRMLTCARRAWEDGHLDAFCEGFLEQRNTEHPEIDHAQRVLTRLANLKEES